MTCSTLESLEKAISLPKNCPLEIKLVLQTGEVLEILSLFYSWHLLLKGDVWGRSTFSAASCQEYGSMHKWNVSFPQTAVLPCKLWNPLCSLLEKYIDAWLNGEERAKSKTISHTLGLSWEPLFRGKCTQIDKQRNKFILTEVDSYHCSKLSCFRYFH